MKNNLLFAVIVAAFCFTAISAQSAKIESIITHRSDSTCTEAGESDPNNGVTGGEICDGALGYKIEITYFEHGQMLELLTPTGEKFELELFALGGGTESYIEKEIEWRVVHVGDNAKPIALIFERNIYSRAYPDADPKKRLSVFKIRDGSVCLIADLKKPDLKKARKIADGSGEQPCRSKKGIKG